MESDPKQQAGLSDLAAQAEAFLFAEGGSLAFRKLVRLLKTDENRAAAALGELSAHLEGSGLSLIRAGSEVSLATAERAAGAVRESFEEALGKDVGNAGLEVLAIVLYRGPSTRSQIDYIRGVNTSSTIRTLLSRGLIERAGNPVDAREYLYRPTAELLAHLGVRNDSELPEYDTIRTELAAFESSRAAFQNNAGDADDKLD